GPSTIRVGAGGKSSGRIVSHHRGAGNLIIAIAIDVHFPLIAGRQFRTKPCHALAGERCGVGRVGTNSLIAGNDAAKITGRENVVEAHTLGAGLMKIVEHKVVGPTGEVNGNGGDLVPCSGGYVYEEGGSTVDAKPYAVI